MTDLLTIFFGFGVFTANSAIRHRQFQSNFSQGFSTRRQGYLPEEMIAYALAYFSFLRHESKTEWTKSLNTNVGTFYHRSAKFIAARNKKT